MGLCTCTCTCTGSPARLARSATRPTMVRNACYKGSYWSIVRVSPRFLRLIGPSWEYTHASYV
eukprot:6274428-Pyramimonas_sp.AAC.1